MAVLNPQNILDSWHSLLDGCSGAAGQLFDKVGAKIDAAEPPNVYYDEERVATGFWMNITGQGREFLLVYNEVPKVKDYKFYITSEPYGIHLSVGWYLTAPGGLLRSLGLGNVETFLREAKLDLFESQELRNFATLVHGCVADSADEIVLSAGPDMQKVNRQTKGFLGLS